MAVDEFHASRPRAYRRPFGVALPGLSDYDAAMKPPRVTLSKLVALVAVVAVNLWFGRYLWGIRPDHLLVVIVTGPALQVGLLLAILKRGLTRAFWLGSVLACSAAIVSLYQ